MNTKDIELLKKIAEHVKNVPYMNTTTGPIVARGSSCPTCFFGEALRVGIIDEDQATDLAYVGALATTFEITNDEALAFLFPDHNPEYGELPPPADVCGQDYIDAMNTLIAKYSSEE